uniref:Putative secreted peptide n=1 Tax=Anopheles braziliensis TaxID=58242 RepID=A0A2M3ZEE1_9DIPT
MVLVAAAAAAVSECRAECRASDSVVAPSKMATLGLSKVFILDKYFTELQKFWETEKKLQGKTSCCYCRCCCWM